MADEVMGNFKLEGGSTRSERAPAYNMIPIEGLKRIAERFEMGAAIHGEDNWMRSIYASPTARDKYVVEAMNHLLHHALLWASGDRSDDHMAAIGWGACAIMYAEANNKAWADGYKRVDAEEETINQS